MTTTRIGSGGWEWAVALLLGSLGVSCAHGETASTSPSRGAMGPSNVLSPAQIEAVARLHFSTVERGKGGPTATYSSAATDLNDDGFQDAVVVQRACERSGCEVLVLAGTQDGLVLVSKGTVPAFRVSASRHSTNGWRDLIVCSDSTPRATYSVLRFDGLGYVKDDAPTEPLDANSPAIKDGMLLIEYAAAIKRWVKKRAPLNEVESKPQSPRTELERQAHADL